MNVVFSFVRQVKVYNHCKVVYVNAARRNVCCNKTLERAFLERVDNLQTLRLRQIADDKFSFKAVILKPLCHNFDCALCVAENYYAFWFFSCKNTAQKLDFFVA